jgi:ribosome-associated translation inhibitor RaiA
MNVHISYRLHKTPAVEKDIQHQIEKLRKRLQVFRPELIHLKGMVEELTPREGISVSLNLRLPSGQMAATEEAATAAGAVKGAFEDLLLQLNKHKEHLRSTHKWTRRQTDALARHSVRRNSSVPFEETLAVVFPATVSAEDVRSYVNANLSRLERFVEREIYFREAADQILRNSISKEEVIDEAIATNERAKNPSGSRLNPGSTGWLSMPSINSRGPTVPTAGPYTWKPRPAKRTSAPAMSPNCSFTSPMKPLPKKP